MSEPSGPSAGVRRLHGRMGWLKVLAAVAWLGTFPLWIVGLASVPAALLHALVPRGRWLAGLATLALPVAVFAVALGFATVHDDRVVYNRWRWISHGALAASFVALACEVAIVWTYFALENLRGRERREREQARDRATP